MKLSYDPKYNLAYIRFHEEIGQVTTIKISDDMNIVIAPDGTVYGVELLNANEQLTRDRTGAIIKYILTKNENRTQASLFTTADRVKVGPTNFAPQYSGRASSSRPRPSSARAFSNFGSSFAHSDARRLRSIRASFSATAV